MIPLDPGLLAAVIAAPDDDLPRLVAADWLDDHGEAARAEFIRVECELAAMGPALSSVGVRASRPNGRYEVFAHRPLVVGESVSVVTTDGCDWVGFRVEEAWDTMAVNGPPDHSGIIGPGGRLDPDVGRRRVLRNREADLIRDHSWPWRLDCPGSYCYFTRGFVSEVLIPWAEWAAHADAILAACPIRGRLVHPGKVNGGYVGGGLVRLVTPPPVEERRIPDESVVEFSLRAGDRTARYRISQIDVGARQIYYRRYAREKLTYDLWPGVLIESPTRRPPGLHDDWPDIGNGVMTTTPGLMLAAISDKQRSPEK